MKKETRISKFQKEMAPAKEIYAKELETSAKRYDTIGKMSLREEPDIDTMDYIYIFERLNGTTTEELDQIQLELYDHMEKFSKANGITKFYQNARIWLWKPVITWTLQNTPNMQYNSTLIHNKQ